jgi:hypothetical protein
MFILVFKFSIFITIELFFLQNHNDRFFSMTQKLRSFSNYSLQIILTLVVFMHCYAQDTSQQNIVVKMAEKYTISFPELEEFVRDNFFNYWYPNNKAMVYYKAMDDMIINQLKIIDFFRLGLNENTELLRILRRSINEELVVRYYNARTNNQSVNEDSIKRTYQEMQKEVVYQQIVLKKDDTTSLKKINSLLSLAKSIKSKLLHGANFTELARKYSQEAGSSRPGNLMPPLSWQMSRSNDVHQAIFHLAAGKVAIIESKKSFYIVKVVKINKVKIRPYEEVKEDIRKYLCEVQKNYSIAQYNREKETSIDEKTLQWDSLAVQQIFQWSRILGINQLSYSDTLRHAILQGNNFTILKHSKGIVDLKEYLRLLDDILNWGNVSGIKEEDIKKYILEAVRTDMLVTKAYKINLEKNVLSPETTSPVLRKGIVWLYNRHEIEEQIPRATEKELIEFYDANKNSLYYQLAKVNIYAIIDSNKNVIKEAKQKLEQNIPFENLSSTRLVKAYIREQDGGIKSYLGGGEPPYLGGVAMKLKLNETAGPIEYYDTTMGKQYALIKCIATREEKQLSYNEAKKTLLDDFVKYHRNRITQSIKERLKKKYSIIIYKDVLKQNIVSMGIEPISDIE